MPYLAQYCAYKNCQKARSSWNLTTKRLSIKFHIWNAILKWNWSLEWSSDLAFCLARNGLSSPFLGGVCSLSSKQDWSPLTKSKLRHLDVVHLHNELRYLSNVCCKHREVGKISAPPFLTVFDASKLSKLRRFLWDLVHTNFAWPICLAVQMHCIIVLQIFL
jgi:hypothetical protein